MNQHWKSDMETVLQRKASDEWAKTARVVRWAVFLAMLLAGAWAIGELVSLAGTTL